jgi:hypothetical protein
MTKERLRVVDRREDVGLWGLFDDNDFTAVKTELDKLESTVQYGQGEVARFCIEPYGYDGGVELHLYIYRDETDAEYEARLAKEEAKKEKARLASERKKDKARQVLMESEAAERAEYERLRAKFGE